MISHRRGSRFERAFMARLAAVQAQYQRFQQEQSADAVLQSFIEDHFSLGEYDCAPDQTLFTTLVYQAADRQSDISKMIESSLNDTWTFDRLELVLKALLFIATAELLSRPTEAPAPVLIGEYVSLARSFFSGNEPMYLNGYLDKVARQLSYQMSRQKNNQRPMLET